MKHKKEYYRPDIDGLRAIAIIAVVGYHAFPGRVSGGFVGVDVFFVISGFLITSIILRDIEAQKFSIVNFYARRVRRIFPALLVVLLSILVLGWWILMPDEYMGLGKHVVAGSSFFSNILLWSEKGYFDIDNKYKPLLHLWSLGIEEQFYLVWPVMLLLIWRLSSRHTVVVWSIAISSFVLNVVYVEKYPAAVFYMPLTRFWELFAGAILAIVYLKKAATANILSYIELNVSENHIKVSRNILSYVGLSLIIISISFINRDDLFPGWLALGPVFGTLCLIIGGENSWVNKHILSMRSTVFIGLISYPLYLWHWPLLSLLHIVNISTDPWINRIAILSTVLISVLAAFITYVFVERPIRHRFNAKSISPYLLMLTILILVGGMYLVINDGVLSRVKMTTNPFHWEENLERTKECLEKYSFPKNLSNQSFCAELIKFDSQVSTIVIGDSHANALWPGIAKEEEMSTLMIGGAGCLSLRNTRQWDMHDPLRKDQCPKIIDASYKVIEKLRPETIVVTSYFSNYLIDRPNGDHFDSIDFPGKTVKEFFPDLLFKDLLWLLNHSQKIVFVLDVPDLGFHPHDCVAVRPFESSSRKKDCFVIRDKVEKKEFLYRRMVSSVVKRINSKRLHVVDPMEVMCDDDRCYGMMDGIVLYRDAHHLSDAGSKLIWHKLK